MKNSILMSLIMLISFSSFACSSKKINEIQLTRTPCYGTCPWYTVSIKSDGSVLYTGRKFVTNEGVFRGQMDKEKVKELFEIFNDEDWSKYEEHYIAEVEDLPSFNLELNRRKGKSVKLMNASFGPKRLSELASTIDKYLEDVQWEKVGNIEE